MIIRYGQLLFILFSCLIARGGDGDYAVSKIPASLLNNAHVVKRMEQISFEFVSTSEAILHKKYALTILDEHGADAARFAEVYDNFQQIRNIEGVLYDAEGRELKRLRNKQVVDMTASDGSNLADDNRWKVHHFYYKQYPYTVEYEVEIKYGGTMFFPDWVPRDDEQLSVEQSSFTLITPASYNPRYKEFNCPEPVVITSEKNKRIYTWSVKSLPAIAEEFASPSWYEFNPVVLMGPSDFQLQNYKGNMDSWQSFGQFIFNLNAGRDQLPGDVKRTVHLIADSIQDPKMKIKKLYEYLQKNTRYVSIQLGIGGWQPFDAAYVAAKSYGDCKALVNYMYSLLKEVGITSYYTLVQAGKGMHSMPEDFPTSHFNHIILCIPLGVDTTWLECTSQTIPAGYLGDFTCDRNALLITPQGGKLVHTPVYGLKDNSINRKVNATLEDDGYLNLTVKSQYAGLEQDNYNWLINNKNKEDLKEFLENNFELGTYEVRNFDYKEKHASVPVIEENLELYVSNYATVTGKRLFILPDVIGRIRERLPLNETRKTPIFLPNASSESDTVLIRMPSGYTEESIPAPVNLKSKFGSYSSSVLFSNNELVYYRHLELYNGRFAANEYSAMAAFYESVYKADRNKVVLTRLQN